uniref:Uncharacterized protein n=1 Tax=Rhizophora mucronata TaxID=61149 RepID=A0A2P2NBN2_RHIMU
MNQSVRNIEGSKMQPVVASSSELASHFLKFQSIVSFL